MKQPMKKQTVPYTQISNAVLNDKNLSWKAKGIFSYLYSKPEKWDFSVHRIFLDSKDGKESLLSGIAELETLGYLQRKRLANGRMEYRISFEPCSENPNEPCSGNPNEVKTQQGKTRTVSNKEDSSNTELESKKEETGALAPSPAQYEEIDVFFAKKLFRGICACTELFGRKYLGEFDQILARGHKKILKWAEDINKLRRIDHATDFEIEFIIAFVFGGDATGKDGKTYSFKPYRTEKFNWYSNIQSGEKLRDKFPKLYADAKEQFMKKEEAKIPGLNLDAFDRMTV